MNLRELYYLLNIASKRLPRNRTICVNHKLRSSNFLFCYLARNYY